MVSMPNDDELTQASYTIDQAARVLNVSSAYLVRVIDDGALPCSGDGDNRRVDRSDLAAYKRKRDAVRHAALDEIACIDQESGGYDD